MGSIPRRAIPLMATIYRKIFPQVHKELSYWKGRANQIPNQELRRQALDSIEDKTFHCEGGSIYAILAGDNRDKAIQFVVAYQTISDYLDNLCDRSTSLDPKDFRTLHTSMKDALTPGNPIGDYYAEREEKDDGGYLQDLVKTCQNLLGQLSNYSQIKGYLYELADLYCDLQVHKHVKMDERVPRLKSWFNDYQKRWGDLSWYEFSACSGSTLGIFCLVSYAHGEHLTEEVASQVYNGYFPYMQGLHILLDYYIDQQEDLEEGDLNFCTYYDHEDHMKERFLYFIDQTKLHVNPLPHASFHHMVQKGLVGLYLADSKVQKLQGARPLVKELLSVSGTKAKFFYMNSKLYHKLKTALA
ncbi:tetraprenyl-beta-curcumene synthase family protein [Pontibacillus salipaludis]|uniref:Tetraprenyl-beta-curcumene synthase n=1 Tax=Pontibacillus salipaludis TaxID=1697394 RepID=A0ABQ1PXS1_9BACI|nr:tetraprenyl-beta-curcumene synthase [Pontibacillus salipaludis]